MEKIAIISDIHGCYISLKNILEDIEKRNISRIFVLGDLVAKGSQPDKVIDLIKEKCEVVIKGNCDEIVSQKSVTQEHFWNREKIGAKGQEYLMNLPLYHEFYMSGLKVRLLHASPESIYTSINYYNITENINDEIRNMFKNSKFLNNEDDTEPDVVIFGHIHSPFLYRFDNKMLINAGTISNSCDLVTKNDKTELMSSYLILEGEYNSKEAANISYELIKLPYDYKKEIGNLKNSDMPNKEMAIEELLTGVYKAR